MSSQHEVAEKHKLVKSLLEKDKFMSPVAITKAVTKKFGSGISRVDVAKIRMEQYGIRLGPGGYAHNKNGNRVPGNDNVEQPAKTPDQPNPITASNDRLARLIGELQAEMALQHVNSLTVPVQGPVEAVQTVRRTIQLPSA